MCFATILNVRDKFCPRSTKCVFLGYADAKKAYKLYNLENGIIFYSRDVKFYENVFPFNIGSVHFDCISKNSQQFVKSSPFYDDPQSVVYDENIASEGIG